MSDRPRFVFDANALVSAALFKGSTPDLALRRALRDGVLLASNATVSELSSVLSRPKFDHYLTREERDQFLAKLIQRVSLVDVAVGVQLCRDPKDDMYLALAQSGNANCIVTGDADLRDLGRFDDIVILTPKEFLTLPI